MSRVAVTISKLTEIADAVRGNIEEDELLTLAEIAQEAGSLKAASATLLEVVAAKETAEGAATTATTQAGIASTFASNAGTSATNASASASAAESSASAASGSASSASTYASNASNSATAASTSANNAASSASAASTSASSANSSASSASASATSAANNAIMSSNKASDAEAYAAGKRGGVDVGSSDATYHNNSKYYAEQAASSASAIINTEVHEPIIADGTWRVYDRTEDEYVDTEVPATGPAPVIAGSKSGGTTTITADGTTIATILDGTDGQDGSTPVISATKTEGVTTITADGVSIATINDGEKGDKGDTGEVSAAELQALLPSDTATGNPATFPDGLSNYPAEALTVKVNPVQSLNGYTKPWARGAGKNLVDVDDVSGVTSQTQIGAVTLPAGDYMISAYISNAGSAGAGVRITESDNTTIKSIGFSSSTTASRYSGSFTLAEETSCRILVVGTASGYNADVFNVQVEAGTTLTDYAPYSNICPISGHDSATLTVNGDDTEYDFSDIETLAPLMDMDLPSGYRRVKSMSMNNNCYYVVPDFHLTGADTLRFSIMVDAACNVIGSYSGSASGANYSLYISLENYKYLRYYSGVYNSKAIRNKRYDVEITPTGTNGMEIDSTWEEIDFVCPNDFFIGSSNTTGSSANFKGTFYGNIEVEGSNGLLRFKAIPCERVSDGEIGWYDTVSGTFYEPTGTTPTVEEYSAVYGGTLDVVNGSLTVDKILWMANTIDMDVGEDNPGWRSAGLKALGYTSAGYLTTQLNVGNRVRWNCNSTNDMLILMKADYNNKTQTEWQDLAIDVQIIIPLITPVVYQLTAQEVALLTGNNSISADTGDVTVTYTADIEEFFNKKIAEVQALITD